MEREGELSILSWNINGFTDTKKNDQELVKLIVKHDIIFLLETWANSNSSVNLSGYVAHNFNRKYQHKRARRCSGGILLYYKEDLKEGIKIIKNDYNTIIWVKLDHKFFKLENDVYICGTYIWGEESPMYNICDVDLFEIIENDVSFFSEKGSVYLTEL